MTQRPTWTLEDEQRPGCRAAADIDLGAALREAREAPGHQLRMDEPFAIQLAAVDYAGEAMQDALLRLALLVRDGAPIESGDGWRTYLLDDAHDRIDFVLTHPEQPGAWCIAVDVISRMTEDAGIRHAYLQKRLADELSGLGLDDRQILMRRILGPLGASPTDVEREIAALKADPASHAGIDGASRLSALSGAAVELGRGGWKGLGRGGRPPGVVNVGDPDILDDPRSRRDWSSGFALEIRPRSRSRDDDMLSPSSKRSGPVAHLPMQILGDMVRRANLGDLVAKRERRISRMPWICYGEEKDVLLQEVGYAAVHRSGGFLDGSVVDVVRGYSAAMAAADLWRHLDELHALSTRLIGAGFTSRENSFDANDMRDMAHAVDGDGVRSLVTATQNGTFRLDIALEGDGVREVRAWRANEGDPKLFGRFAMTEAGLVHDFDGALSGEPPIDYTIRNVRDMNGVILSLTSVACVFAEEHPEIGPGAASA